MNVFTWIAGYVRKYRFRMAFGLMLVVATSVLSMVNPYLQGIIVDRVILGGEKNLLMKIIAMMIGSVLLKTILRYTFQMVFENVSQGVLYNIRENIFAKVQNMDFAFFDRTRTGDIMARMTGDLDAVRHFVAWVVYNIFENLMVFVFAIIMLFSREYRLALLMVSISPIIGYLTRKLAIEGKPAFSAIREQFSRLNSMVQENISGNRVVKAFTKEGYETEKFTKENNAYKQSNLNASRIWEKYLPVLDSLAGSLSVVLLLVGGTMVIKGSITLGELVTFNGYIWALNNPMRMSGWLINDVQRFSASADKVISILSEEPSIFSKESPKDTDEIKGLVEFRDVTFSYGDEEVLKNINFTAKPGEIVAFIGPTGSGKSTLVNLISRFYDCSSGNVLIDGVDVKDYDLIKLRESISMAMQDIFLFSDTIEGNIAYGVPDATLEQIKYVAQVAGAHEFISGFPEGYDTIIGERGVGLSGGQRQRIALARALLKNPAILVLDDITSSVDIETEQEIHKSLKSFYSEKTVFIIAHRISSIKNADRIFVLEDGQIVEQGRHNELLAHKGYYYNVFKNQYGDFDSIKEKEVV